MRQARIHLNYGKWDNHSLATLAGRTLNFMTGNTYFAEPNPSLEVYGNAVTDYIAKHEVSSNGGSSVENTARDNARILVLKLMKQMAFYVNTVADGDPHILASSGFEIVDDPQSKRFPGQVKDTWMKDGRKSGEVKFGFSVVRSATAGYDYALADTVDAEGTPVWGEMQWTSRTRMNYIDNLIPGQRYYLHVRARNNHGIGDWSEPVSFIVR